MQYYFIGMYCKLCPIFIVTIIVERVNLHSVHSESIVELSNFYSQPFLTYEIMNRYIGSVRSSKQ